MGGISRRDRSIHQVSVMVLSQLTLGDLRALLASSADIPDRAWVYMGTGSEASTIPRSILVSYEGALLVDAHE